MQNQYSELQKEQARTSEMGEDAKKQSSLLVDSLNQNHQAQLLDLNATIQVCVIVFYVSCVTCGRKQYKRIVYGKEV